MAPVALLALACVILTASVPASDSFTPKKSDGLVFGVSEKDISVVNLKTKQHRKLPLKDVNIVSDVALDPQNSIVYWTDGIQHTVNAIHWDGTNQTTIFTASTTRYEPYGLAVDPAKGLVFFAMLTLKTINAVGTDGKHERTVVSTSGKKPSPLALDVKNQYIFYSFRAKSDCGIGRVGYNGKGDIVVMSSMPAVALTLIVKDDRIYWACDNCDLKSSKLDGSDPRTETTGQHFKGLGFWGDYYVTVRGYKLTLVKTDGYSTTVIKTITDDWYDMVLYSPPKVDTSNADDKSVDNLMSWVPKMQCLKVTTGTAIKITKGDNLGKYSLLVTKPPAGCSQDRGELSSDITIPDNCVSNDAVEVAVQLTDIKYVIGGQHFRQFRFSCSSLDSDGKVQDLSTDNNPGQLAPTESTGTYADGTFSLFVTTDDVTSPATLTSSTSLNVSQGSVYLVIQHSLAKGSQHRTLIPLQCDASSSTHSDKMAVWASKPGSDCVRQTSLLGSWTVVPHRNSSTDATYTSIFPFDFKAGEEITLKCSVRECPGVRKASDLKGACKQSIDKLKACGGSFQERVGRTRAAVISPASQHFDERAATRVVSATFTLV